jgi:hypothetical protein
MNKNLRQFILFILITVLFSGVVVSVSANTKQMNLSEFLELLIKLEIIPKDNVSTVRNSVSTLNQTIASTTPYIQVLSPNGGESWDIDLDLPYTITWGSTGLNKVDVALVSSNAKTPLCNLTSTPITTKDGNNTLKILLKTAMCINSTASSSTPLVDGSYKVRVYGTDSFGTSVKDESNAVFKILPVPIPSLKVTYPNGAERLIRNDEYVVKYTVKNIDDTDDGLIYLYLLDNNGNTAFNSHKLFRKDGTYNLDLSSSLKIGAYKIKLKLTTKDHVELEDMSDNFFWVSNSL